MSQPGLPATLPIFARLLALYEDAEQEEYRLESKVQTIGRLPGVCTIVVERQTISRIHAQIEQRGSHYIIRNLGRNGTYVNGLLIGDEQILQHGDKIGLTHPEPLFVFADSDPTVVPHDILRYDEGAMLFYLYDQPVELTPTLFRLLLHFYRNQGKVCTREECAEAVWQNEYLPEYAGDNLDKAIFGLRARLRRIAPDADLIQIRRGLGYVLEI